VLVWYDEDNKPKLWWVLGIFIVLKILKHDQPQWWLWFGLVTGLGLLTKVTIACPGSSAATTVTMGTAGL
jgi:hypothetical protein